MKKSFSQISRILLIPKPTVHKALRRFVLQNQRLEDRRVNNGRNNQWNKLTPEISTYLLSTAVLQRWSGLCLDQRCMLLDKEFNLKLTVPSLYQFYKKNNIRYLVASYQY